MDEIIRIMPGDPGIGPDVNAQGPAWQDLALCAETDPEIFYPEKGGGTRAAKQVCRACPVRTPCLEFALEHDERWGVYGGLSPNQRKGLKRRARAA